MQGAILLNELGIIDEAARLLKDAKKLVESSDAQKTAEINNLIEQFQQHRFN